MEVERSIFSTCRAIYDSSESANVRLCWHSVSKRTRILQVESESTPKASIFSFINEMAVEETFPPHCWKTLTSRAHGSIEI